MLTSLTKFKLAPNGCLLWAGSLDKDGYGAIRHRNVVHRAHRLMYEQHFGPIQKGLVVMHSCDNPKCVNPSHLSAGTPADNMIDMRRKGRDVKVPGERNGMATLTDEQVKAIRNDVRTQKQIASDYGITQSQVSRVKSGKRWGHLSA